MQKKYLVLPNLITERQKEFGVITEIYDLNPLIGMEVELIEPNYDFYGRFIKNNEIKLKRNDGRDFDGRVSSVLIPLQCLKK